MKFGADGIGLCRTEHMFFDPERISAVRQMIMAPDEAGRRTALALLLPFQRDDFHKLFRIMGDLPITIRLLDPPLHEFLPHADAELADVARALGANIEAMRRRAVEAGRAGQPRCWAITRLPAGRHLSGRSTEMQARAIFEGALEVAKETGAAPGAGDHDPIGRGEEGVARITRAQVDRVAEEVFKAPAGRRIEYTVGIELIELPHAQRRRGRQDPPRWRTSSSFGTNDLTQTVFGLSRDDAGKFLPNYVEAGILPKDPFVSIDIEGVGAMIRLASERGRQTKNHLKLGICGEHGGDPASISFCQDRSGLDYVSCSPYRVPVARLAAAQAALGVESDRTA